MARPSYPSPSLAAAVRTHFGLTQAELARFLDVSREHLANAEAGRRDLGEAPRHRLWVLAHHLPPPNGQGLPVPQPGSPEAFVPPPPDSAGADLMRNRLRRARFLLTKARFELRQLTARQQAFERRGWALKMLRAALAPAATPGLLAAYPVATPTPDADLRWLDRVARDHAATPPPLSAAERTIREARLRGLEAEVAALEAPPAPNPEPQ